MLSTACALAALLSAQNTPNWPTLTPQAIHDSSRLARTPLLDGKIDDGEWQPWGDGSYLQWEPGTIYFAAKAKAGEDIVMSLDGNGDGWLQGNDNLELRATIKDNNVVVSLRRLDATDVNGPRWIDTGIADAAVKASSKMTGDSWELECAVNIPTGDADIGPTHKIGARIDVVPAGSDLGPPYVPRAMSFQRLAMDSSTDLFPGMSWKPILPERIYYRGDPFILRYDFHVAPECPLLKGVEVSTLSMAGETTAPYKDIFPPLGRDRNVSVTYKSALSALRTPGYRVVQAKVVAADGSMSTLYSSIYVGDQVQVYSDLPETIDSSESRIIHANIEVKSSTEQRVDGSVRFVVPKDWTPTRGEGSNFAIVRPRGRTKLPIEFIVPKGSKGLLPIEVDAQIGDKTVARTYYIKTV